jgi:hypothetical protein
LENSGNFLTVQEIKTWTGSVLLLCVSAAPPIATIVAASWVKRMGNEFYEKFLRNFQGYFNLVFASFILKIIVPSLVLFWCFGGVNR